MRSRPIVLMLRLAGFRVLKTEAGAVLKVYQRLRRLSFPFVFDQVDICNPKKKLQWRLSISN